MTQDLATYYVWIGGSCDYGHKERAGGTAVALTEKSRNHAGCIAYAEVSPLSGETAFRRKGPSRRKPLSRFLSRRLERSGGCIGRRSVCETWKDDASLKAHAETPEFKKYVAEIEACGQMKLERFD